MIFTNTEDVVGYYLIITVVIILLSPWLLSYYRLTHCGRQFRFPVECVRQQAGEECNC